VPFPAPASPNEVVADARVAPTTLQHAAHAITEVYMHIVESGCWSVEFSRGARPFVLPRTAQGFGSAKRLSIVGSSAIGAPPVRRLATRHLGSPATDGWNVVAGAIELARRWALPLTDPPLELLQQAPLLDRLTRMRLAVCLATSWNFQRNVSSLFPREFCSENASGDPEANFSFELGRIGYLFLYEPERRALGPWPVADAVDIQSTLLEMQVQLVAGSSTFPMLAQNWQVAAEERLEALLEQTKTQTIAESFTMTDALTARAIVPFFVRAAWIAHGAVLYVRMADAALTSTLVAGGALACAAWLITDKHTSDNHACNLINLFSSDELLLAGSLLMASTAVTESRNSHVGCYGDPNWFGADYVSQDAIRATHARLIRAVQRRVSPSSR
jgi:hypothetical protein